jgi:hypothetical protein
VEVRFFWRSQGCLLEALKILPETVKRDWRFAKAWLLRALNREATGDAAVETSTETPGETSGAKGDEC